MGKTRAPLTNRGSNLEMCKQGERPEGHHTEQGPPVGEQLAPGHAYRTKGKGQLRQRGSHSITRHFQSVSQQGASTACQQGTSPPTPTPWAAGFLPWVWPAGRSPTSLTPRYTKTTSRHKVPLHMASHVLLVARQPPLPRHPHDMSAKRVWVTALLSLR
jgi:hypothetical protein